MSMLFLLAVCLPSSPAVPSKGLTPNAATPTSPAVHPSVARAVGPHFQIEVQFGSQLVADQALAAAESAVAPAESIYGAFVQQPDPKHVHPPRIVLYAGTEEYDTALRPLSRDRAARERGFGGCLPGSPVGPVVNYPVFHDPDSRASHVLVEPTWSIERLTTLGLSLQTKLLVATEAARFVADAAPFDRSREAWWFADGAAQWAAEEGLGSALGIHDRMDEPVFCAPAKIVRAAVDGGWMSPLVSTVAGDPAYFFSADQRALDGAVFRFLKDPARAALYARVSAAAEMFHLREGECDELLAALGDDEARVAVELEFEQYGLALQPKWTETAPALTTSGTSWLQVAMPDHDAIAWRTEPAGTDRFSIEGELEILPGPKQQMNVLLCGNEDDYVQVSFVAGHAIEVSRFEKKVDVVDHQITSQERWTKIADGVLGRIETGRSIRFRVLVEGGRIAVAVDGNPVCSAPIDEANVGGRIGVGVSAASAGRWRKFAFARL